MATSRADAFRQRMPEQLDKWTIRQRAAYHRIGMEMEEVMPQRKGPRG